MLQGLDWYLCTSIYETTHETYNAGITKDLRIIFMKLSKQPRQTCELGLWLYYKVKILLKKGWAW